MTYPALKWTKGLSTLALLGLVLSSGVLVLLLDSGSLVSPTIPIRGTGGNPNQGPTGILSVTLMTNQDVRNPFADPVAGGKFPLGEQAMGVYRASNATSLVTSLITSVNGTAIARLSPDYYVVKLVRDSQSMTIPVQVVEGKVTFLTVRIEGRSYPVAYGEISDVTPTGLGHHETLYAQVRSPTLVAKLNDTVLVKLRGGVNGQIANATVIGMQQSASSTWLRLDTAYILSAFSATDMIITTYSYSYFTHSEPTGLYLSQ